MALSYHITFNTHPGSIVDQDSFNDSSSILLCSKLDIRDYRDRNSGLRRHRPTKVSRFSRARAVVYLVKLSVSANYLLILAEDVSLTLALVRQLTTTL